MNELINTSEMTNEELRQRINDCRIRILEELGIVVPASLREGTGHEDS